MQGHRGDDAERAQADPGGGEELAMLLGRAVQQLAVAGHQLQAAHLGGQTADPATRAVGAGRDRAGDGLAVDVAEAGHRQAELPERGGQVAKHRPGGNGDQPGVRVGLDDSGQLRQVQHHAPGRRDVGEAVAGADGLDRQLVLRGAADLGGDLVG